jgi:regulator of RNase E activity RraB
VYPHEPTQFKENQKMNPNKKTILIAVGTILTVTLGAFGSYSLIKYLYPDKTAQTNNTQSTPTPSAKPIDAMSYCPLNGKKYSVDDQLRWEQKRPVAVMIENHPESRPQSGLSSADIVYEAVAEGGITRFMGVFLCDPSPQWTGPVRSARTYFLDWLLEYDAFYAHVGGANTEGPANALGQIKEYGVKDFEGLSESLQQGWQRIPDRNPDVALEHTMYLDIERLRKYAMDTFKWGVEINEARWDATFEKGKYTDLPGVVSTSESTPAAELSYGFWDQSTNLFGVKWTFDSASNTYKRQMAGTVHVDKNTNQQVAVTNVIVMVQDQSNADDGYTNNLHLLYKTIGKGNAYISANGKMTKVFWSKSGRTAKTKFIDATGKEVQLPRGKIWISVVPTFNEESIKVL